MQFNLNRLLKLRRAPQFGGAPHKPVLLLAVVDLFENTGGMLNWVEPNDELVTRFIDIWNAVVNTPHSPTFALPFYHLKNEPEDLWNLVTFPGRKIPTTQSRSIKSYPVLLQTVAAAKLDNDFYQALLNPIDREVIRQTLLDAYFPNTKTGLQKTLYSEYIRQEILVYDPSENYARTVKKKLSELKPEEAEQEIVVRSTIFKKAIVELYHGKCAVSGLDVSFKPSVTMVDACHIIPFADSYDDTIRNGIALSPTFHRAFDRGLIAISDDYTTLVHPRVNDRSQTYGLSTFQGKAILLPQNSDYYPDLNKLGEHRRSFGY